MDIASVSKIYFNKMLRLPNAGMKILVMDDETLAIMSVSLTFSEIMKQEVFLVERVKSSREPLKHLIGIFFLRPTADNICLLTQELHNPRYSSYYLFFSHALSKQALKQLAEADIHEVVSEVQEFFADFLAISPHLFFIDRPLCFNTNRELRPEVLTRCAHSITAALLALKRYPLIRYQNSSDACKSVAKAVRSFISRETVLFDFRKSDPLPTLLIIDRRQDPITPLLSQWTYEAMIHELIGIKNNRVTLSKLPNSPECLNELNLSREYDDFFRNNQYMNFGEIGQSVKKLVDNFQNVTKTVDAGEVNSLSDLKGLLENYPAFRKASGAVQMHVSIVSELSRLVKERCLLEVSEVEQELVCQDNHAAVYCRIRALLMDQRIKTTEALRLVLLYVLRYESNRKEIATLSSILTDRGLSKDDVSLVGKIIEYSGSHQKFGNLDFHSNVKLTSIQNATNASVSNATSTVASFTKRLVKGRKGVENIYTQHEPVLIEILRELVKGQLKDSTFPVLESADGSTNTQASIPAKEIIIFVVGGATFEESFAVQKLLSVLPDVKIILGSSYMHNSASFIDEIRATTNFSSADDFEHQSMPRNTRGLQLGFSKLSKSTSKSPRYSLLQ